MGVHRAIYGARKALGLDDDTARDFYERAVGKRHLTDMSADEQNRVLVALNREQQRGHGSRLDGPYAAKLQALWIAAFNLGVVDNRRDEALLAFVKRQTGLDHTRFLREAEAAQGAVEALKAWLARAAGVVWKAAHSPQDCVIEAQIALLPEHAQHLAEHARAATGRGVSDARKRDVMNRLGVWIRTGKGPSS